MIVSVHSPGNHLFVMRVCLVLQEYSPAVFVLNERQKERKGQDRFGNMSLEKKISQNQSSASCQIFLPQSQTTRKTGGDTDCLTRLLSRTTRKT